MVIAQINAKLMPMDRGEHFEDPLDRVLKEAGRGEVTGGGSMLEKSGEISYCDIEIGVPEETEEVLNFVAASLEDLGAPKGSKLTIGESERPLGRAEGIAVYLNGTDLPDDVYQSCDFNFVCSEFARILGKEGRVLSTWQGATETALYMYGPSFDEMRTRLEGFLATYPLCQKCRVAQIA